MNQAISTTVIYPVEDLARARATYRGLIQS
jgi:hypothetical protein